MRKRIFFFSIIVGMLMAFSLVGCANLSQYDVQFYDGDKLVSTLGTTAQSLVIPDAPEKAGFDFDGWYLDEGEWKKPLTVSALADIPLTSKTVVKVYAHYTQKTLPLELDGFNIIDDDLFYKAVSNSVSSFDFEQITHTGGNAWVLCDSEGSPLSGYTAELTAGNNDFYITVTLGQAQTRYAVTVRRKPMYTVSFDTVGGSPIASIEVEEGEKPNLDGLVPQKDGYVFSHWSGKATEAVKAPITLTAVYVGRTYTVNLDASGGALNSDTVSAVFGSALSLPTPQKTGYTFTGWYNGETLYDIAVYDIVGDIDLTAKYTPTQYTVTYALVGGQNAAANAKSYTIESDDIALSPATRDGAVFDGWYTDAAHNNKIEKIAHGSTGDITLYAKWDLIDYTITYHCNGGDFGNFSPRTSYNVESDIMLDNALRADYTFSGWYTNEQLSGAQKTSIVPGTTGDLDLYAKWQYGTEGLVYTANGDNYIVSNYTGTSERVVIPATMDGKTVTSIGGYALATNETIKHVEICNGITAIGVGAFSYSKMQSISIPASVTTIEHSAFSHSDELQTVYYNAADVTDFDWTGNLFYDSSAFDLTIGADVTRLPAYFICETAVKSITFEQGSKLTRIGERAFSSVSCGGTITLPDSVKTLDKRAFSSSSFTEIILPDGLTTIGDEAFASCKYITELVIPATVQTVGTEILWGSPSVIVRVVAQAAGTYWQNRWNYYGNIVIYNCLENDQAEDGNVYTVYDGGLYAIADGGATLVTIPGGIDEIIIPDTITYKDDTINVTGIASKAFGATKVKRITLPAYMTEIPAEMFMNCGELLSVTATGDITSIGARAFEYCYKLTAISGFDNVTALGEYAFYNCKKLDNINFPKVTVVSNSAFSSCWELENITLSPELTEIGGSAFEHCSRLHEFTFPDTLTKIGSYAFSDAGIWDAQLPDSLTNVGSSAFHNSYLYTVHIPTAWESIPDSIFYNTRLRSVIIPSNVKTIESSAFSNCDYLEEVTLQGEITDIKHQAFNECVKLKTINLPSSLNIIGERAFYNCKALTDITLPDTMEYIGSEAFYNCLGLRGLILHTTVERISNDAFKECKNLSVFTDVKHFQKPSGWGTCLNNVNIFYNSVLSADGSYVVGITRGAFSYDSYLTDIVPPPREGYAFGGWFLNPNDDSTRVTSLYPLATDTNVYAKWIANDD